ncbi:MAG: HAMP domain-containing methyl-accepting chemotaxis protein, partial [Alphaproteobacteria bacterium]
IDSVIADALIARSNLADTQALFPATLAEFSGAAATLASGLARAEDPAAQAHGKAIAAQATQIIATISAFLREGGEAKADEARRALGQLTDAIDQAGRMLRAAGQDGRTMSRMTERERARLTGLVNQQSASTERSKAVVKDLESLLTVGRSGAERLRDKAARDTAETTGVVEFWTQAMSIAALSTLLFSLGLGAALLMLVRGGLARPLAGLIAVMREIARGKTALEVPSVDRADEIGEMGRAVQVFRDNAIERERLEARAHKDMEARAERQVRIEGLVEKFRIDMAHVVKVVGASTTSMHTTAENLASIAAAASKQAAGAAGASEEASTNVQTVATASAQLSASIAEISAQVSQAQSVVSEATSLANRTNIEVRQLAGAAEKIGEVVGLIHAIAEQTNLLALNATIEAARAGEAGRGFAVVAGEVKGLASQTSKATDEIATQVSDIQGSTANAVEAIRSIAGTMDEINMVTTAIAAAIEEQGAATEEISRNVKMAASGTEELSHNVAGVTGAIAETSHQSSNVLTASTDLAKVSELLSRSVDVFLQDVAAA